MKLIKNTFIFEAFRNKLYPVSEAVSDSLSVLKEIEMLRRVKTWISFAAYNVSVFCILRGIFVFKTKDTSTFPVVGTGKYHHEQNKGLCSKTSDPKPRRKTSSEMTDVYCRFKEAIASCDSLRGIIGGNRLHYLNSPSRSFWTFDLINIKDNGAYFFT